MWLTSLTLTGWLFGVSQTQVVVSQTQAPGQPSELKNDLQVGPPATLTGGSLSDSGSDLDQVCGRLLGETADVSLFWQPSSHQTDNAAAVRCLFVVCAVAAVSSVFQVAMDTGGTTRSNAHMVCCA